MKAVFQSVFVPHNLTKNAAGHRFITRCGWVLIVARWAYYSILFQFRDYHGRWAPFVAPPFDIQLDTYARLQSRLALPFGIGLMLLLAVGLVVYLRSTGAAVPFVTAFNILGAAFFLPFVLVQPIDWVMIAVVGWRLIPVSLVHTAILVWESWAVLEMLSTSYRLDRPRRHGGMIVVCGLWILITGILWR